MTWQGDAYGSRLSKLLIGLLSHFISSHFAVEMTERVNYLWDGLMGVSLLSLAPVAALEPRPPCDWPKKALASRSRISIPKDASRLQSNSTALAPKASCYAVMWPIAPMCRRQ